MRMSVLIEKIERLLEDGRWHTFTEIEERLDISEAELRKALSFLREFGFLNVDEEKRKVKFTTSFLRLPTCL